MSDHALTPREQWLNEVAEWEGEPAPFPAAHTPGPWDLGEVVTCEPGSDDPVPSRDTGYVTMGDENEADIHGPDAPANARLIAAAPDMLAALRPFAAMADFVDEWSKGVGPFTGQFDANDLRRAREVLAKAEGRS